MCIGTGPSLTLEQIDTARQKGFRLFGCNNVYQIVPDLELLYGCNLLWWEEYWHKSVNGKRLKDHPAEKWTTNYRAAEVFGINHIRETNRPGLSEMENMIHHGQGAGYSLVSMAHKQGAERILLFGYDLKYAEDYDGKARNIGSTPRHYFDEYPPRLQHWPSVKVVDGVHVELVDLYRSIRAQGLVEIINCTPGSALKGVIPSMSIGDC